MSINEFKEIVNNNAPKPDFHIDDNDNNSCNIKVIGIPNSDMNVTLEHTLNPTVRINENTDYWKMHFEQCCSEFIEDKIHFPNLSYEGLSYIIWAFQGIKTQQIKVDTNVYKLNESEEYLIENNDIDWHNFHTTHQPYSRNLTLNKSCILDNVSKFLYNNWSKINPEYFFSEKFLSKLILRNKTCKVSHALLYFFIIYNMLKRFQDDHLEDNSDSEAELEGDTWNCPEFNFILKINDCTKQTTGLFTFIYEGMID